ncbi:MAG: KOW domain-containing RNA-binding protein [Oscillospiraceae bacterium]|nr:KOW domain-containing RNA-binding protein [Oscillospiraceae bacterium]
MEYRIGQKVRSKAGRDNGTDYVVIRTEDNYVYVADGAARRLENPKKKKIKHVEGSYNVSEEIAERLHEGSLENYMIRRFLNS